ncbi:HAD hydrolase-like protein [Bradyrhizobium sp. B124]|uniref:HAD family hydrolase n=1 Tax=Bradyrhizobium sp. B124 TaxID=3140245 RepID=UPI003184317E
MVSDTFHRGRRLPLGSPVKSAIVFDWNGTLLDDASAVLEAINAVLIRFSRAAIDMHRFREEFELPLSAIFRKLDVADDEVDAVLGNDNAIFHDTYEPLASRTALRKGAKHLLLAARRQSIPTIILSNHIVEQIRVQIRRLGIETYVTTVLAFESRASQFRSMSKEDRLRQYMQVNDLSPARTVIVGDMEVETEIARNLGLISVSITGGFVSEARLRAAQPDYIVHDHHELVPILQNHDLLSKTLGDRDEQH